MYIKFWCNLNIIIRMNAWYESVDQSTFSMKPGSIKFLNKHTQRDHI